VNVQNGLAFCVDESSRFERLNPIIRPATVVSDGVFAVEECRVDSGVTAQVVLLRRAAQQHSPECGLDSVKPLD
jgi:hypothetical protein